MATETSTSPCPCGSGSPEAACCAPLLAGGAAASPEALMRSRYTAYVRGAIDYIVDTNDPATRDGIDREASAAWSRETRWQGLEILSTRKGGPDDEEGEVEFIARGTSEGKPFAHHERARFRRIDGRAPAGG
jgi:SEC-C motif domain protein